jgi:hypothetical protein
VDPLKTQYNPLKTLLGPPDFGVRGLWLSERCHPRWRRVLTRRGGGGRGDSGRRRRGGGRYGAGAARRWRRSSPPPPGGRCGCSGTRRRPVAGGQGLSRPLISPEVAGVMKGSRGVPWDPRGPSQDPVQPAEKPSGTPYFGVGPHQCTRAGQPGHQHRGDAASCTLEPCGTTSGFRRP